jgi:hypothetical protein
MKWSVVDNHPNRAVLYVVDKTYYPLAAIFSSPDDESEEVDGIYQNDEQRVFNARLMAAAPELLAALLLARDMMGKINSAIEKAIGG